MKIRLDDLLVELGFFPSKEKARTCIMMNGVELGGKLANKAGAQINKEKFFLDYKILMDYSSNTILKLEIPPVKFKTSKFGYFSFIFSVAL